MALDPVIGAGLISGAGSLIGGITNAFGQSSANETNIQLARENREWQEMMWNKQNEYNSPAAQIQRMKEAGLNPALMYSQGNVGNAGSPGSIPTPQVQPITGFGNGISGAADSIGDAMIKLEQVKQMRAQTKLLAAKATKEVNTTMSPDQYQEYLNKKFQGMLQGNRLTAAKAESQETYNDYQPILRDLQIDQTNQDIARVRQDMAVQLLNYKLNKLMTHSKIQLNSQQKEVLGKSAALLEQKYWFLENMNPVQYDALLEKIGNLAANTKALNKLMGLKTEDQKHRFLMDYLNFGKDVIQMFQNQYNKNVEHGLDLLDLFD